MVLTSPVRHPQVWIFDVEGTNESRNGSWEGDVIGRFEVTRDLQPCLAGIENLT